MSTATRLHSGTTLAFAALWAIVVSPNSAVAQEASALAGKQATQLEVAFEESDTVGVPHYLTARLIAADGSAVAGERVRFTRTADIFGGRAVELGRPRTDNAGIARVPVVPRALVYPVIASFSGTEGLEAAKVSLEITFPEELVARNARPPRGGGLVDPHLSPIADVMPGLIGTAVLVVWVVLVTVALAVIRGIRTEGRKARQQAVASARDGDAARTSSG